MTSSGTWHQKPDLQFQEIKIKKHLIRTFMAKIKVIFHLDYFMFKDQNNAAIFPWKFANLISILRDFPSILMGPRSWVLDLSRFLGFVFLATKQMRREYVAHLKSTLKRLVLLGCFFAKKKKIIIFPRLFYKYKGEKVLYRFIFQRGLIILFWKLI